MIKDIGSIYLITYMFLLKIRLHDIKNVCIIEEFSSAEEYINILYSIVVLKLDRYLNKYSHVRHL